MMTDEFVVELWWRPALGEHADRPERSYYWSGPSDPGQAAELGPHAALFPSRSAAEEALQLSAARPPAGCQWSIVTVEEAASRNDPLPRRVGWSEATLGARPPESLP
jgi:hypothetical protein